MTDQRSGDPIAEAQARVAQAMRGLTDAGPRIESIGDTAQGVQQQVRVQAEAAATAGRQAAEQVRGAAAQVPQGQAPSTPAPQAQYSQPPTAPRPQAHYVQPSPQGQPHPAQEAAQKAQKAVSHEVRDVKRAGQRVQNRADAAVDRSARSPLTGVVGGMVLLAVLGVFFLLMGLFLQAGFGTSNASAVRADGAVAASPASAVTPAADGEGALALPMPAAD